LSYDTETCQHLTLSLHDALPIYLWLNESFAEYVSTLATAEATEWDAAWTTFNAMEKTWAYRQDQLPSTHPIVAPIDDLEDVQVRSEEHTSELQSRENLVCRLLLE